MTTYAEVVRSIPDLAAYYPMDVPTSATTGLALPDASGNGRDGVCTTAPTRTSALAPGSAAAMSGGWGINSSSVASRHAAPAPWTTGAFTVSGWFQPTSLGTYDRLFSTRVAGTNSLVVGVTTCWDGTYSPTYSLLSVGATTHVVVVVDAAETRLYKDGALWATPYTRAPNRSQYLLIGNGYNGTSASYGFKGAIDEVACYARALTVDEIAALYVGGDTVAPLAMPADGWGIAL